MKANGKNYILLLTIVSIFSFTLQNCRRKKQKQPEPKPLSEPIITQKQAKSYGGKNLPDCKIQIMPYHILSSTGKNGIGISLSPAVGQIAVAWIEEQIGKAEVMLALMSRGEIIKKLQITSGASAYPPTAITWNGKEFILAWGDDRFRKVEIFTARIKPQGRIALRPKQFTETKKPQGANIFSSDSSQEPTLTYYLKNTLIVWGGPGQNGRQQIYHTTISSRGKPMYEPVQITHGPFNHEGMQLSTSQPFADAAILTFCLKKNGSNELFRVTFEGTPPVVKSAPERFATTTYNPCLCVELCSQNNEILLWAERKEEKSIITNIIKALEITHKGSYRSVKQIPGVELIKFPGRWRRAFDATYLYSSGFQMLKDPSNGEKFLLLWISASPGQQEGLYGSLFSTDAQPLCKPVLIQGGANITDPRVIYSGFENKYIVIWADRSEATPHYTYYWKQITVDAS